MTVVLKLGGSLITRKGRPETVDDTALDRATADIADADPDRLVVVHGGGSFGHPAAAAHGVSRDEGTSDAGAVRAIHAAMGRLNDVVVDRLADRGVSAVPVRPFSAAARDGQGDLSLAAEPVITLLAEGFVPVLHGDVVAHRGRGATILSGDEIVTSIAMAVDADRIGLCTTVPGVLDGDGEVVARVESYATVADAVGGSDDPDVTGGMAAKVRALLDLDTPAQVFGPDGLAAFLADGEPGTRVG